LLFFLGLSPSPASSHLTQEQIQRSRAAGERTRGSIRGPGLQWWDISLFKNTRLTENTKLQFRAEAFNIFNHTNFDAISTARSSSLFGRVTSRRDPRVM
jgi:hypothetical protein